MNNDEVYAQGLLNRAMDPSKQPPAISSFLQQEFTEIRRLIPSGCRVLDFGCGMGRHLIDLQHHVVLGVGFDYERAYVSEAVRLGATAGCYFFVADATNVPLAKPFDAAVCLTNTWGTMSDQTSVLNEMRRLSPVDGSRLLTVYSVTSVPARREWYANLGHEVLDVTETEIVAEGGFTSEHFTENRLRQLLGPCELHPIGDIAFVAQC